MPRKGHVKKRQCLPDTKFGSPAMAKFINSLMRKGKKSVAEKIMYRSLDIAGEKLNVEPFEVFKKAMENVRPLVEVRPRRVGGATYQVPVEVPAERAQVLCIRWMLNYSRSKKGMPMAERLAREFMDAYKGEGSSIKKKEDTHKMAEANRAFAHYRW
ncbi:MAG: 30S ribosomal protein S7 [Synergistaceae bacterium]|jgi:small subunit ribosomal protein S7|uniref:30S ribosomal protein S7 n=1 Tax=Aminivibrio sp. TaxID=1872489 RepID=UPI0016A42387|nr:30S ribosomal protein S7 [Synergistaceae bacterium]NCC56189.1 30S ribosomal protein S7 [Synergistales bacterium]MDD3389717.1 30S ribosomal protein S7 [Synergistaceae bacterium]MDD3689761.1 30S ribosomal protein S7 [Synergistaceae bacterium]MDD4020835.1 30S ribosomal protein S7 [Synergistaceae bacterium]